MQRFAAFAVLFPLALALHVNDASAQTLPVQIVVDPSVVAAAPPDAIRTAVSSEVGAPVVAANAPEASTGARFHITAAQDGRIEITYLDATGREVSRFVTTSADPAATVATIAWVAGTLAHANAANAVEMPPPPPMTLPSQPMMYAPPIIVLPPVEMLPPTAYVFAERPVRQHHRALTAMRWVTTSMSAFLLLDGLLNDGAGSYSDHTGRDMLYGFGAAFAVASIVLWLVPSHREAPHNGPSFAVTGHGVGVRF